MLLLRQSTIAPIRPGWNMSHRQTSSAFAIHLLSSGPPPGSAVLRPPPPGCCGCGCRWAETGRASPPPAGTAAPALPTPVQRDGGQQWETAEDERKVFLNTDPPAAHYSASVGGVFFYRGVPICGSVALKSHLDFLLLPFCTQIECPGFMRHIKLYERHQIKMYRRPAASLHPQKYFFFCTLRKWHARWNVSQICSLPAGKSSSKTSKKKILGSCSDKQI